MSAARQPPLPQAKATDDVDMYIGARLRFWRRILNIDSKNLARKLQITSQQLQKYEKGVNRISASRLYKISQVLQIPIAYFYQDIDVITQSLPRPNGHDVLRKRLSAIEFMTTEVAVDLCRTFISIRNPYTKDALLQLMMDVAARDRENTTNKTA